MLCYQNRHSNRNIIIYKLIDKWFKELFIFERRPIIFVNENNCDLNLHKMVYTFVNSTMKMIQWYNDMKHGTFFHSMGTWYIFLQNIKYYELPVLTYLFDVFFAIHVTKIKSKLTMIVHLVRKTVRTDEVYFFLHSNSGYLILKRKTVRTEEV